ncbi:FAD-binding oxidoreductase [Rhodococcus sp. 06-235-1A]|uniref:FAD-binding and (Fe-S)-binding domain-containing protein n=1 Tax=Rhodococcus sp. 06-235-1A TaxID=2022508 RepID=UPI000B9BE5A1|nr:FAD-binding and (Fe-S)-binding domain-containing protein [Rhodococcus sp. 06-235-1A]OZD06546.1 FAD-binding oxidoreductase [Rhodococcus sp. 06-235-1A]
MPPISLKVLRSIQARAGLGPHTDHGTDRRNFPDRVHGAASAALVAELVETLGDQVLGEVLDLARYASDASPYRMIPSAVVVAEDLDTVIGVLAYAHTHRRSVVFRAAGTSLSGQSQTDDLLVDVRKHWGGFEILDDGKTVRARPGAIIGHINAALKKHQRVLGPDPASSNVACVGGVVSNNASGMAAGTAHSSYATVRSMTLVLPNGTTVDTAAPDAERRFHDAAPELAAGLLTIRDRIRADTELATRLRHKYEIKNTNGYRLVAFLDADSPLEIFRRLVIGSEGTLAFIAEVVFDTVQLGALHTTALLLFPDLRGAADAVEHFVAAGARAVELMDAPTLRLSADKPRAPASWATLTDRCASLLVEFRAADTRSVAEVQSRAQSIVDGLVLLESAEFTSDDDLAEFYWWVRGSLMAGLGASRPPGTTLIVEDVCVRPEHLAEASRAIAALQGHYGYPPGVAGHASAGNLHFILALDASSAADRTRYEAFMDDLAHLVVDRFDGSLKAEHGTGRNMTPFLELEWGRAVVDLMWKIKSLADPHMVLAPGVMLNRDNTANMSNLKTMPAIETIADACFECGFCEQVCPSRDITTTPRQRISLRREMERHPHGSPTLDTLLRQYEYDAVQTCAGDSSCAAACPVGIDTGALMKDFRTASNTPHASRVAVSMARHWSLVERVARTTLRIGARMGTRRMTVLTALARRAVGNELVPSWIDAMPTAAPSMPSTTRSGAHAVYLPACINRIFGPSPNGDDEHVVAALTEVSARAGKPVWIPDDVAGTCCATVWHSKGYTDANTYTARQLVDDLWRWSEQGRLPIVVDATSCTLGVSREILPYLDEKRRMHHTRLQIVDSLTWAAKHLLPTLRVSAPLSSMAVHPTCSARTLELGADLMTIAAALAETVDVPASTTCCGFAGDRGFLHPELTESATRAEAAEVILAGSAAVTSSNRTCEVGLEHATGRTYESIVVALARATRTPSER